MRSHKGELKALDSGLFLFVFKFKIEKNPRVEISEKHFEMDAKITWDIMRERLDVDWRQA
jgi:hypothetical protein